MTLMTASIFAVVEEVAHGHSAAGDDVGEA